MSAVFRFKKETRAYWWGASTHVVDTVPPDDGQVIRQWEVWQREDGSHFSVDI